MTQETITINNIDYILENNIIYNKNINNYAGIWYFIIIIIQ